MKVSEWLTDIRSWLSPYPPKLSQITEIANSTNVEAYLLLCPTCQSSSFSTHEFWGQWESALAVRACCSNCGNEAIVFDANTLGWEEEGQWRPSKYKQGKNSVEVIVGLEYSQGLILQPDKPAQLEKRQRDDIGWVWIFLVCDWPKEYRQVINWELD